jgi:hypothetical protein
MITKMRPSQHSYLIFENTQKLTNYDKYLPAKKYVTEWQTKLSELERKRKLSYSSLGFFDTFYST